MQRYVCGIVHYDGFHPLQGIAFERRVVRRRTAIVVVTALVHYIPFVGRACKLRLRSVEVGEPEYMGVFVAESTDSVGNASKNFVRACVATQAFAVIGGTVGNLE